MSATDLDDIVFEKLNKEYGAYFLRKMYNRVVVVSIAAACILGSALVVIPFLRIPKQKNEKIYAIVNLTAENLGSPGEMTAPPPPPPSSKPPRTSETISQKAEEVKYMAPVIVDTVILIENKVTSTSSDSLSGSTTDLGLPGGTGSEGGIFSENGGGGGGTGGSGLYTSVEIMPKFKGGDVNKFREWVQKKTVYSEIATINGIHGKVYVSFIVEKDGSVSNVKVAKGVDPLIDDEAVIAVKSSPKWTPGRQRGIPVRVSYIIMLDFKL